MQSSLEDCADIGAVLPGRSFLWTTMAAVLARCSVQAFSYRCTEQRWRVRCLVSKKCFWKGAVQLLVHSVSKFVSSYISNIRIWWSRFDIEVACILWGRKCILDFHDWTWFRSVKSAVQFVVINVWKLLSTTSWSLLLNVFVAALPTWFGRGEVLQIP